MWIALAGLSSLIPAGQSAADAPTGHFVVKGEVVEDTATKLSWQRTSSEKSYSDSDAEAYCTALNLAGTGWRLPTIKELHTLVDETKTQPAMDGEAFPDAPASFFWTSSHLAKFPQYTWCVNFTEGSDAWFPGENPQLVRCVR
jgi:hypothetical protein